MPIIRVEKHHHNYVIIDKSGLEDDRLSLRARGLLAYFLTKPDDWEVNLRMVAQQTPGDSRQALTRTMQELEHYGYARRVLMRDQHGKLHGYQTFIYEKPLQHGVDDAQPITDSPTVGFPRVGEPTVGESIPRPHPLPPPFPPVPHSPPLPLTPSPPKQGIKETKHPPPPPSEGGAAGSAFFSAAASEKTGEEYSPAFEAWWTTYPAHRRIHKKACYKRWRSSNLDARSEEIIANTAAMKQTRQWQEGKITNSTTYLHQERYDTAPTDGSDSGEMSDSLRAQLEEIERQFIAEGGRP